LRISLRNPRGESINEKKESHWILGIWKEKRMRMFDFGLFKGDSFRSPTTFHSFRQILAIDIQQCSMLGMF